MSVQPTVGGPDRHGYGGSKVVQPVLLQHIADVLDLFVVRSAHLRAAHVKLRHLGRIDMRLAAHLRGVGVAGEVGLRACETNLSGNSAARLFPATVRALEDGDRARLGRLLAVVHADSSAESAFLAAFAWVSASSLRGLARDLLASRDPFIQRIGATACAMHRVSPGVLLNAAPQQSDRALRCRLLRAAAELGKRELVSTWANAIEDEDPQCRCWAAWAAVLLGDKHNALDVITDIAAVPGPFRERAFQLFLNATGTQRAHGWLATLAQDPSNLRWLIRGAGLAGDPAYVPWLIGHMADNTTTRLAGEAFSLITGLDLAWLDLEVKPPQNFESGPNDDPSDPNVDMDEDDGLPWPDAVKVQTWWHANAHRFQPGVRYFMGEPLNRDNCLRVLKEGFQRQRIAAALYLSLLNPGTPLFEWRAPARRQQRLLAEMV